MSSNDESSGGQADPAGSRCSSPASSVASSSGDDSTSILPPLENVEGHCAQSSGPKEKMDYLPFPGGPEVTAEVAAAYNPADGPECYGQSKEFLKGFKNENIQPLCYDWADVLPVSLHNWYQMLEEISCQPPLTCPINMLLMEGQPPQDIADAVASPAGSPFEAPSKGSTGKRPPREYNTYQVLSLETLFRSSRYMPKSKRIETAQKLDLTEKQVKDWFHNQRMKWKKRSAEVTVPGPITTEPNSNPAARIISQTIVPVPQPRKSGSPVPTVGAVKMAEVLASSSFKRVQKSSGQGQEMGVLNSMENEPKALKTNQPPQQYKTHAPTDGEPGPCLPAVQENMTSDLGLLNLSDDDKC